MPIIWNTTTSLNQGNQIQICTPHWGSEYQEPALFSFLGPYPAHGPPGVLSSHTLYPAPPN
jgi:hypothetical protein